MKNYVFKVLTICGLLISTLACSIYQAVETETQNETGIIGIQGVLNTFNLNCDLMIIKINTSKQLVFPLKDARPTLNLSDGKYSGFNVCNSFYGNLAKEGNAIKFKGFTSSTKNCIGDYGFVESLTGNDIENLVYRLLSEIDNYSIEQNKLILKKDSDVLMIYKINE
jgi:heat shock protein HslJ